MIIIKLTLVPVSYTHLDVYKRQRPDLLIVGEIRDKLTAQAVLRASLTGYTRCV